MGKSGIERACVSCRAEASHANARVVVNGVNSAWEQSRQSMIRGPSARDNSIVTAFDACRVRVQRLREIKTNVLSLAHLHGAHVALRADD
jgi:hypothetical protein